MRPALRDAADDEIIESNSLAGYTYARAEHPKEAEDDEIDVLSPKEQRAVLAKRSPTYRNLIQFALWTGMRPSQYIALNWPMLISSGASFE